MNEELSSNHNDTILWAGLEELSATVGEIPWPEQTYMLLEKVPTGWVDEPNPEAGLCLRWYDATENFEAWERGRIFCEERELCWEKQDGRFQTVYVGEPQLLTGFSDTEAQILAKTNRTSCEYYLWGQQVRDGDLATVNAVNTATLRAFAELRIPRLLYYPIVSDVQRAKLRVYEYMDDSGSLVYHRFYQIQGTTNPIPKQENGDTQNESI